MRRWLSRNRPVLDAGLYFASTAVNQAVPFLILPLMTVYLRPDDYGFVNTFSALAMIAVSIFNGLQTAINKHYYVKEAGYNQVLLGNLFLALAGGNILLFLASLALVLLGGTAWLPGPFLMLIPAFTFFFVSLEFLKTILKIAKKAVAFAFLTGSGMVVEVSLSLFLVIGLSMGWRGRVVALAISAAAMGAWALAFLARKGRIRWAYERGVMREIIRLAVPLIPSGLSVMIMRRSGVLFIDSASGKFQAGLYGVAMNLAAAILFLSVPVINVWLPFVYERLAGDSGPHSLQSLHARLVLLGGAACLVTMGFALFSGRILGLMTTGAYAPAARFIPWLAFGFCFWAISSMLTPFIVHFGRQGLIALIASTGAALNLGLNFVLIRRFGPIGAAVSFFLANMLCAAALFVAVRRMAGFSLFPGWRPLLDEARRLGK